MLRKIILIRTFAVLLVATPCICDAAAGLAMAQEPVKIGLSGPFTGGSSAMGVSLRDGAKLAAEEINAAGGVNVGGTKRPIQFIERDDEANNALGVKNAQDLIGQKVIATVSYDHSL